MKPPARATISALVLPCAVVAGCAASRTIIDKMQSKPLSATPFHEALTDKAQCMHCHTQLAAAPAVPHPDYEKCVACHETSQ